ncbi:MAG: HD domain-containing protein [Phycisphaerae bacterium]|nr:HD domain-containing protein [Phycisphaerae bacterium]
MTTNAEKLQTLQLRDFRLFGERANRLGLNFALCGTSGEILVLCETEEFKSNSQILSYCGLKLIHSMSHNRHFEENRIIGRVVFDGSYPVGAVLVHLPENTDKYFCDFVGELLDSFHREFEAKCKSEQHIDAISEELSQVYEELVLLHKLGVNMKLTEAEANFLQMAADSLTEVVPVEGIAVLLRRTIEGRDKLVLTAGLGLIDLDDDSSEILFERLRKELTSGREALLDSEVDSPFRYHWPPGINNIIAVPFLGTGSRKDDDERNLIGMMVAVNRRGKADFDSPDVKLFNSIANSCAVFVENGKLFMDIKELFIGSLRALTSSIDAKDQYTRGHSERVAFISKWLAERLDGEYKMSPEQIHTVYLAGLLHDIGKIGIGETVLCKEQKLTNEEYDIIKSHPAVGAGILEQIKQMRNIIPGVLCHHERLDGKGYPQGLKGENIPLIGRIVAVADTFDAMTSKRTYRDAMSLDKALSLIKEAAGTQLDEKIVDTFINSDIYTLWKAIADGFVKSEEDDFAQYGAAAVGVLVK